MRHDKSDALFGTTTPVSAKGYFLQDGRLWLEAKKKNSEEFIHFLVGDEVIVSNVYKDIHSNQLTYELLFKRGDEVLNINLPREDCSASGLTKHNNTGAPFLDKAKNSHYAAYIEEVASKMVPVKTSRVAGWVTLGKDVGVYVHGLTVSADGINSSIKYSGSLSLESQGKPKEAIAAYNTIIKDSISLQAALCMGLSAIVVNWFNLPNLFIHVYGDSTTGKSTMLKVVAASFGNPEIGGNFVKTFFATKNAFIQQLTGNQGVVACFDEVSAGEFYNEKFLYQVYGGTDKMRYIRGDGKTDAQLRWRTSIVTTGEAAISAKSNKNNGAAIRVLEFADVQWTQSAEEAEQVSKVANMYFGKLCRRFASEMLTCDNLDELYAACCTAIHERLDPDNRLAHRVSEGLAAILFAGEIAAQCIDLEIDTEKLTDFLLTSTTISATEESNADKVLEMVKSTLVKRGNQFNRYSYSHSKLVKKVPAPIGQIFFRGTTIEKVVIIHDEFLKMLRDEGFEDANVVIRQLEKAGFVKLEKGGKNRATKNYNRAPIDGQKVKVMEFEGFLFNNAEVENKRYISEDNDGYMNDDEDTGAEN